MKKALLLVLAVTAAGLVSNAQLLFTEDFETAGGDHGYTLDPDNDCGCCDNNDMWGRTTGIGPFTCSGVGPVDYVPTGISGTYFFGVEDLDDISIQVPIGTYDPGAAITLDPMAVTGYSNLQLEVLLATPNSSTTAPPGYTPAGQFETTDSVFFQYAFDADIAAVNYTTMGHLVTNTDNDFAVDLDGDRIPDGPGLDSALTAYSFNIPASGNTLSIRVLFYVNGAHEEVAMDRMRVLNCNPTLPTAIAGDLAICAGDSTTLSVVGGNLDGAAYWQWREGSCSGTIIGTGDSIKVAPSANTDYFVEPAGGCYGGSGSCTSETVVVNTISADFTGSPLFGCGPLLVNFTDLTPGAVDWYWEFGDGGSAGISSAPSFLYQDPGIYTVSLIVTDVNGCIDTVEKTNYVQVIGPDVNFGWDTTTGCAPLTVNFTDSTIFGAPIVNWSWDFGDGGSSNLQNPTYTYTTNGKYDVSLTITDIDGCMRTMSVTELIDTRDTVAPTISCPADQTENLDASCGFSLPDYTGSLTVSDACDATPVLTQVPAAGSSFSGAGTTVPVKFFATDASGNVDSCSITVTLQDVTAPTVSFPPGDTTGVANASCQVTLPDFRGQAVATDACDASPSLTQSPAPGTTISGAGTSVVVTITATDASSNAAGVSFNFTVADTTAPFIIGPTDQTAALDAFCMYTLPDFTGLATVADNCDASPSVTQSPVAGTVLSAPGSTVITLTVTDASGNSADAIFNFILNDVTAPTVSGPGDQTESVDASCQFIVPDYRPSSVVTDACDASPTMTQSPAPGAVLTMAMSPVTVTVTAADAAGNTADHIFLLTLEDLVAPVIDPLADQDLWLDATCDAVLDDYRGLVSVSDNCSATPTLTQVPAPGTPVSGVSSLLVTITATDDAGNSSFMDFTVNQRDPIAPVILFPGDQMEIVDAACQFVLPDYRGLATVTDNCDAAPVLTQDPLPGTIVDGSAGPFMVTLTATDFSGYFTSISFYVLADDVQAPVISGCPSSVVVTPAVACEAAIPDLTTSISVSDNCSSVVSLTQSHAAGTLLIGPGAMQTVTVTATDDAGNSSTCLVDVALVDNTAPVITCPADEVVAVDEACKAILQDYRPMVSVFDLCETGGITQTPAPGTILSGGSGSLYTVTFWVSDASGNSSSCSMDIQLEDQTPPQIAAPVEEQTLEADSTCSAVLPDYSGLVDIADNCTSIFDLIVTQSPVAGTVITETTTVTVTVRDEAGLSSLVTFDVGFINSNAPQFDSCPSDIDLGVDPGFCGAVVDWIEPTAFDYCLGLSMSSSHNTGQFFVVGSTTVEYTATNDAGLTEQCAFEVRVHDDEAPEVDCPTEYIITQDDLPFFYTLDYTDNCGISEATLTDGIGGGTFPLGTTTEVYVVRDLYGNETVCSFDVTVMPRSTGIDQVEGAFQVTVFPNPTSGPLQIRIDHDQAASALVRVLDAYGRLVLAPLSGQETLSLDLSGWAAGAYFIDVAIEGRHELKRIILVD